MKILRTVKYFLQSTLRGWNDSETWSLDVTLAKHILPRLIRFRDITLTHPPDMSMAQWKATINKMIFSFAAIADESWFDVDGYSNSPNIQEGLDLFAKHYTSLWW